jgi:hypothetical protein
MSSSHKIIILANDFHSMLGEGDGTGSFEDCSKLRVTLWKKTFCLFLYDLSFTAGSRHPNVMSQRSTVTQKLPGILVNLF